MLKITAEYIKILFTVPMYNTTVRLSHETILNQNLSSCRLQLYLCLGLITPLVRLSNEM